MKEIEFGTCMGKKINNLDAKKIEYLLEKGGMDYWGSGSGQSMLRYSDNNKTAILYLSIVEDFGFYLEYYTENKYYVILSNNIFEEIVEIYIGGDPVPIPKSMVISKKETVNQVLNFIDTGNVDYSRCNWILKKEANWDYGYNINEKEFKENEVKSVQEILIKKSKIKRKWMK